MEKYVFFLFIGFMTIPLGQASSYPFRQVFSDEAIRNCPKKFCEDPKTISLYEELGQAARPFFTLNNNGEECSCIYSCGTNSHFPVVDCDTYTTELAPVDLKTLCSEWQTAYGTREVNVLVNNLFYLSETIDSRVIAIGCALKDASHKDSQEEKELILSFNFEHSLFDDPVIFTIRLNTNKNTSPDSGKMVMKIADLSPCISKLRTNHETERLEYQDLLIDFSGGDQSVKTYLSIFEYIGCLSIFYLPSNGSGYYEKRERCNV